MTGTIWVIGLDYGTEGQKPPEMAFTDEGEAKKAYELVTKSSTSWYLAEVPLWRPWSSYD